VKILYIFHSSAHNKLEHTGMVDLVVDGGRIDEFVPFPRLCMTVRIPYLPIPSPARKFTKP